MREKGGKTGLLAYLMAERFNSFMIQLFNALAVNGLGSTTACAEVTGSFLLALRGFDGLTAELIGFSGLRY